MDPNYKCQVDIELNGGDVQITVSGDGQTFAFISGLGFFILPDFFWVLASFYKEENNFARLDCHGNSDYYNFISDGTILQIEHIGHYPESKDIYVFNLSKYVTAIDKAFSMYLEQTRKEGILHLQEMGNPLGQNVIDAYHEFSAALKK